MFSHEVCCCWVAYGDKLHTFLNQLAKWCPIRWNCGFRMKKGLKKDYHSVLLWIPKWVLSHDPLDLLLCKILHLSSLRMRKAPSYWGLRSMVRRYDLACGFPGLSARRYQWGWETSFTYAAKAVKLPFARNPNSSWIWPWNKVENK